MPPADPTTTSAREIAARLGRIGVWSATLSCETAADTRWYVGELERLGAPVLWVSEGEVRKEIFSHLAVLLAATTDLIVASSIANIHARDAQAMANGERTLGEVYPGRVVLGLGVSHAPKVQARGGHYERPVQTMRAYLEAMDAAPYCGPRPSIPVPRLIGAQGPRMLRLSAERTAGAHPYFVPVEHTAIARDTIGPDPVLAVEQAVVLERDPDRARTVAREYMQGYLKMDNYRNSLLRLGFTATDIDGGGSDDVVDAIVAWGDADALCARVQAHLDAGADHVCVQVLGEDLHGEVSVLERLLPAA